MNVLLPLLLALTAASDWHVSTRGTPQGDGTAARPLDLATALGSTALVKPGDTVWIAGGVYEHPDRTPNSKGFKVRLTGGENNLIWIRPAPGERVTLDGGLHIVEPTSHVGVRDLEITVSEPNRETTTPGSHPGDIGRPWGGLEIHAGKGCRYVNLVIHGNMQGIGFWSGATDSEVYGCLVYDNGWQGPDRHHGHCLYTQNQDGLKTIANNILCAREGRSGGSTAIHAYGTSAVHVDNYEIIGNICFGAGNVVVGGARPSKRINVSGNYLYGLDLQVGYLWCEGINEDAHIRDNVVVNGWLSVYNYKRALIDGVLTVKKGETRPDGVRTALLPNKYDPSRAHLAIYNWRQSARVAVNVSTFLRRGETFRLLNPRDFYGPPVLEGTCDSDTVTVPMQGEFAAFVMVKGR